MALWCHYQQSISLRMYVRERALGIKSDDYSICLLLCTYIVHSKTIQLQLNRKLRFYFVFSIRLSVLFELCSLHQTDNEILECSICDYRCLCLIMDKSCVCVCVGVYIGIYTHQAKKKEFPDKEIIQCYNVYSGRCYLERLSLFYSTADSTISKSPDVCTFLIAVWVYFSSIARLHCIASYHQPSTGIFLTWSNLIFGATVNKCNFYLKLFWYFWIISFSVVGYNSFVTSQIINLHCCILRRTLQL